MTATPSVKTALLLFRVPAAARKKLRGQLPPDLIDVIKIAAGDQTVVNAAAELRETEETVTEACQFYMKQVVFSAAGDKFRILGLNEGASLDEVVLHKRWLLKWLHPDRNHNSWETQIFNKISESATALQKQMNSGVPVTVLASQSSNFPRQRRRSSTHRPQRHIDLGFAQEDFSKKLKKYIVYGALITFMLSTLYFAFYFPDAVEH